MTLVFDWVPFTDALRTFALDEVVFTSYKHSLISEQTPTMECLSLLCVSWAAPLGCLFLSDSSAPVWEPFPALPATHQTSSWGCCWPPCASATPWIPLSRSRHTNKPSFRCCWNYCGDTELCFEVLMYLWGGLQVRYSFLQKAHVHVLQCFAAVDYFLDGQVVSLYHSQTLLTAVCECRQLLQYPGTVLDICYILGLCFSLKVIQIKHCGDNKLDFCRSTRTPSRLPGISVWSLLVPQSQCCWWCDWPSPEPGRSPWCSFPFLPEEATETGSLSAEANISPLPDHRKGRRFLYVMCASYFMKNIVPIYIGIVSYLHCIYCMTQ